MNASEIERKSILDGMDIKEFGCSSKPVEMDCTAKSKLEIVGHCHVCGAPIYGLAVIAEGAVPPGSILLHVPPAEQGHVPGNHAHEIVGGISQISP